MNKIKSFISSNKITVIILAVVLVAVITSVVIYFSVKPIKPPANDFIPTGTQASSKELEEVSNFTVPIEADTLVDKIALSSPSSVASVAAPSKEPNIKVDGNPSSKATSSKPAIKVDGNTSNKPVSSKPTVSKPTPPPASSQPSVEPLPPPVTEPVEPPYNPDGPQHGDTRMSEYTGQIVYYHIGVDAYIDEEDWKFYKFDKHPEATENIIVSDKMKYLVDGDLVPNEGVWCAKCKVFVGEAGWNDGRHYKVLHMSAYDAENLTAFADHANYLEAQIRMIIQNGGGIINEYNNAEEFVNEV
ncbi:MAG: hypothetical protein WAX04_08520 [Oscillospiraceae bacterium]